MRLHGILSRDDFPLDLKTATIMEYITPFLYLLNTMAPYLLLGFLLAGVIHAYVPRRLYARYLSQPDFRSVEMSVDDVVDILSIPLIGVVPDDENVVIATNQGEPLVGNHTLAGRAYRNICQRILGQETPYLLPEPTFSFWTKFTGIFHKSQEGRV